MSKFFAPGKSGLAPYVPGEQPRDMSYIKLNTNESPFSPSEGVRRAIQLAAQSLQRYSDPSQLLLRKALAQRYGNTEDYYVCGNGSDDLLNFIFLAFSDEGSKVAYPEISYGFYDVLAGLYNSSVTRVPLRADYSVDVEAFCALDSHCLTIIANPNAPTGHLLSLDDIRRIVEARSESVCVIDEAYIDFGGQSALSLIPQYENLLVVQTYSKSRSLAGLRLGFASGQKELIEDIQRIRNSINPYNVSTIALAAGVAALEEADYYKKNCERIEEIRAYTSSALELLGFEVIPSYANFVFVKTEKLSGKELYEALKEKGILVRHFEKDKITEFNRISIGSLEQMETLIATIKEIFEEREVGTK